MADSYNYDEQGQFFPFFVIALLLLVLIPFTYKAAVKKEVDTSLRIDCTCKKCQEKKQLLETKRKKAIMTPKNIQKYALLALGWSIVIYMGYRIATTKVENKIWDPFAVLGIPSSSTPEIIKSHYKKLSRALHPDKVKLIGNMTKEEVEAKFVDITKAYKALTDEEIRRNYEEYGHPDGKQEFSVGIALPKWIVESSNGYYVLAGYGLLFGVLLPAVVGRWWYGSRSVTKEGIETETAARYFRSIKESTSESDVVDMIAASHEHEAYLNANDNQNKIDSVALEKKLAQANVSVPSPNAIADGSETADLSRNFIYAHLNRIDLGPSLEPAKLQIISDTLKLQTAMIQIALAYNYFEPVRSAMEMCQHLLQAIPVGGSPLLQLPGISQKLALELRMRKKPVKDVQGLLSLEETERRKALDALDDTTYSQAINVARQIPILQISNVHFKVPGDKIVTPGAIVQLIFTARLATEKDFQSSPLTEKPATEPSRDDSDVDEDDVDVLIGRKKAHKDGDPQPLPLAHAPYFPLEHKPTWWTFLSDPRGNRIIVHPASITDIGAKPRKFRIQFQAPPQVASYLFQLHVKSDSYVGTDYSENVYLHLSDPSKLQEKVVEDVIPEADEDSEEESDDSSDDDSYETDTDTDTDTGSDSD